jgi:hypothetical protein
MIEQLKKKSFWITGAVLFTLLILLTAYQMVSVMRHVDFVEQESFKALSEDHPEAADVYRDCSSNIGQFKGANVVTLEECKRRTIEIVDPRGSSSRVGIAFENYENTRISLIADYKEPWPLNKIGMPLIRALL